MFLAIGTVGSGAPCVLMSYMGVKGHLLVKRVILHFLFVCLFVC